MADSKKETETTGDRVVLNSPPLINRLRTIAKHLGGRRQMAEKMGVGFHGLNKTLNNRQKVTDHFLQLLYVKTGWRINQRGTVSKRPSETPVVPPAPVTLPVPERLAEAATEKETPLRPEPIDNTTVGLVFALADKADVLTPPAVDLASRLVTFRNPQISEFDVRKVLSALSDIAIHLTPDVFQEAK